AVASATTTGDVSGDAQTDGLRFLQVNNFYKDAKPSEAILLKPLVAGIVERTEQLLEEWPDHAVLQQIGHMSKQLLLVPVTAPLAKLLAGLEMLYQRAQDWQAYASRDVSIEQLADVARLIVRWRQAELNAWPHLLLSQELEFARRPNEWWFNLYSSLLGSELTDFAALVSAIDQFMQASPAGEFRGRLNMLHAFCSHRAALLAAQALQEHKSLTELKLSDSVYAPLANAIDYYSQYAPCIAEHLANAKKAVKKDLTQYVKISSWKDVNPAALKESALRTHRHLARCVRQWREALSQPIFQIIQISQTANIANAKVPTVQLVPLPLSDAGIEIAPAKALAVGSASVRPWSAPGLEIDERLALELAKFAPDNLAKVLELSPAHLQQLHRMMQRSDAFAGAVDGSGSSPDALEEFALQVVGDINHFQNVETPKHLTKKPVTGKSTEPSSASKKNKLIIKSKKQKQEEEEEEYIEDDEERQRKIVQFWGEQRNLRRTRLKEILKALAGLGLKRNFRPASTTDDDNAGSHGLSTVLKQSPLDVSAWTESVRALATSNTDGVHGDSARAQRQWQLANAVFFRLSSQLAQLRTVMHEEHSAEINAQQVLHISGLMESLNQQVVRDRRAAADLVGLATDWLHLASVWANEPAAGTSSGEPCGDVAEVKRAVDELACLLTQCVVGVRKVSSAEGWERDDATTVAQIANKFDDASVQVSRASDALAVALTAVVAPRLAGLADANVPGYLARFEQTASATQTARASIASVQSVLDFIAETGWDTMPMQSWLTPICACVSRLNNLLDFAVSQPSAAELLSSELASLTGQWATAVMNVWQQVHKAEQQFVAYGSETDMWGLRAKELVHRVEMMQGMSQALHLPKMLGLCRSLISLIATQPPCSYIHGVLRPWITQYSLLVQHVVCLYADFHKTLVQFALTATTVLTSVIVHGLGSNDIYDSEETDESMESGTGMGEGSTAGAKNVSDEIEGEDQVEGLQGEEPDDTNDAGKDEDAIEMENDFQGQLGDADLETDDDDSDKSDDEDDENQMDEQLGDVDPTDPTALDEKLWDDDQEEDKPEESKGDDSKVDSKAKQKKEESDI
ncbi:AAA ATPase midasin, partial [Linderina macrospora]